MITLVGKRGCLFAFLWLVVYVLSIIGLLAFPFGAIDSYASQMWLLLDIISPLLVLSPNSSTFDC